MAGQQVTVGDTEPGVVRREGIHSRVRMAHRSGKMFWPSVVLR
jgi:hypothetical protein